MKKDQKMAKRKAIIIDLDGTLALNWGRDPYKADTCDQDCINKPVAVVVKAMALLDYAIIIITGRNIAYIKPTKLFLKKHKIIYDALYMREDDGSKSDSRLKKQIYEDHIQKKYNILFVLDDFHAVVKMWREELKLIVFQVNEGNLRFPRLGMDECAEI